MHKLSKYIIRHVKGKSRPFGSEIQFCPDIVKKRWPQKMDDFLDKEISELQKFFTLRAVTRKRWEILGWVIIGQMMADAKGTKRLFGENWLQVSFDCVLVTRSRLRAAKCDPLAKIRGVKTTATATIFKMSAPQSWVMSHRSFAGVAMFWKLRPYLFV